PARVRDAWPRYLCSGGGAVPASRGARAPDGDRTGRGYAQHSLSRRALRLGPVGPGDLPYDRGHPPGGAAPCAHEAEARRVVVCYLCARREYHPREWAGDRAPDLSARGGRGAAAPSLRAPRGDRWALSWVHDAGEAPGAAGITRCSRARDAAVALERGRAAGLSVCKDARRRRGNDGECPWVGV